MYLFNEARKLDYTWKLWRRNSGELEIYDFGPQKDRIAWKKGGDLPFATPESQGISSEELINLYKEIGNTREYKPHSLVIVKNGKVISSGDWKPYSVNIRHMTHSMCKSVVSLAVGIAEKEGLLTLNEKLGDIFRESFNQIIPKRLREATVEHLLTMTTGAKFAEADVIFVPDWFKKMIESDTKWAPGTKFEYNSLNTYMLAAVIEKKSGMGLCEYLKPRLFDILDIQDMLWEKSPEGIAKGGWGCYLSAMEMAKLGLLCMNGGRWQKDGRWIEVVLEDYIRRAVTPIKLPVRGFFGYGYQIWTAEEGYMFNGMFGQYVIVFPEQNTVIAMTSGNDRIFAEKPLYDIFAKYFVKGKARKSLPLSRQALAKLRKMEKSLEYGKKITDESIGVKMQNMFFADRMPEQAKKLDGVSYRIAQPSAAVMPLMLQCLQGNYSTGIKEIKFEIEDGIFYFTILNQTETRKMPVGFGDYIEAEEIFGGEKYITATKGEFKTDEDDNLVLKITMCFTETTSTRMIKIVFLENDEILLKMSETPVFERLIKDFFASDNENVPKGIRNTIDKEQEIMELVIAHMADPVIKGKKRPKFK